MKRPHKLILRQARKYPVEGLAPAQEQALDALLDAVSESYHAFDADRALIERSMELSSSELLASNSAILDQKNELHALYRVLMITNWDQNLELAWPGVLSEIRSWCEFPIIVFESYQKEKRSLRVTAFCGGDERSRFFDGSHPIEHSPAGALFLEPRDFVQFEAPVLVPSLPGFWGTLPASTVLSVPIEAGGERIGALTIAHPEAIPNSFRLLSGLNGLSAILGSALERVRLAEQMELQRTALAMRSKMSSLGEMAGGLAHEINNPLAVIGMLSEQLVELSRDERPDTGLLREHSEKIAATVRRIAKIVTGLRSFSRDGSQDPFVKIPVSELIEETLTFCAERFRNHAVELRVRLAPDLEVEGRATELSQVILNLLNNAHDAVMELPEKWVELHVRGEGEELLIEVCDAGTGISEEVERKLFQPFFTTKEIGKGTGLGLSISVGIINNHGGQLGYVLRNGRTCFRIRLPRSQTRQEAA